MAQFVLAKDPVQPSGRSQERDMALVQWSQWASCLSRFRSKQDAPRLPVGGRFRQQVFNDIQRQTTMGHFHWPSFGYRVLTQGLIGQNGKCIVLASFAPVLDPCSADLPL